MAEGNLLTSNKNIHFEMILDVGLKKRKETRFLINFEESVKSDSRKNQGSQGSTVNNVWATVFAQTVSR